MFQEIETEFKSKKIFAGSVHGCLISENREIYSWGYSKYTGHNVNIDILKPKKKILKKVNIFI